MNVMQDSTRVPICSLKLQMTFSLCTAMQQCEKKFLRLTFQKSTAHARSVKE